MPVLVLLVVVAGGVGGWKVYQDRQREKAQAATSASSAEVHEAPVNSNSSPPTEASSPASAAPQAAAASSQLPAAPAPTPTSLNTADQTAVTLPFELTVRPKDQAWVSVKADGRYLVRGIIAPPAVKTIHASTEIIFYTGNAGAVEVAFNGKGVPLTAGPNQPQTLVFNSHGAQPKGPAQ
jgi:cytoskeletal protein RodZ